MHPPRALPSIHLAPDGRAFATNADVAAEAEASEDEALAAFNRRNFASVAYLDGKSEARPVYQLTRDDFAPRARLWPPSQHRVGSYQHRYTIIQT